MPAPDDAIARPSALLLALETRGLFSLGALLAAAPFLARAPRGEPQAALVVPGLHATDRSTVAIRLYLKFLGYDASGWGMGRNNRPAGADLPAVAARIRTLREASGARVSLIGWSRGGLIAREATRMAPECVRMVITLGSPFAGPAAANIGARWRRAMQSWERVRALADPMPVPSTSIFSRTDGIVAWQACLEAKGPFSENVEVRGSHIGLGFNPAALWVIADRLAQPIGRWRPFRPSGAAAALFPRSGNAA
jgi:pimeloyl-ACP methyl ester carboxylesterase